MRWQRSMACSATSTHADGQPAQVNQYRPANRPSTKGFHQGSTMITFEAQVRLRPADGTALRERLSEEGVRGRQAKRHQADAARIEANRAWLTERAALERHEQHGVLGLVAEQILSCNRNGNSERAEVATISRWHSSVVWLSSPARRCARWRSASLQQGRTETHRSKPKHQPRYTCMIEVTQQQG